MQRELNCYEPTKDLQVDGVLIQLRRDFYCMIKYIEVPLAFRGLGCKINNNKNDILIFSFSIYVLSIEYLKGKDGHTRGQRKPSYSSGQDSRDGVSFL
jgi:hypothetical protein